MAKTFSQRIRDWSNRTLSAAEMIRKASAIELATVMQRPKSEGGNMPVLTGYLRASFTARVNSDPVIGATNYPAPGQTYSYNPGAVNSVISRALPTQSIKMGYQAAYATYQEYGTDKFAPCGFVRLGVQQWPQIIERNTRAVRQELGL